MRTRRQLENTFRRLGIDFANTGFCETPEFQAVERDDPTFLKFYAMYVRQLQLSPEYIERARNVIQTTADFLFHELVADGRRGACVDISGLILRFLERQGIWCHVTCGGLKIQFPAESGIGPKWFFPLMHRNNNAFTGHAWIYAPPYKVIDISVSLQPYPAEQQRFVRGYNLAEECHQSPDATTIRDLMEPELIEEFVRDHRRMPTMNDLMPELRQFMRDFAPCRVVSEGVSFNYMPVKISAPDLSLEQMLHPTLSGRRPMQVFEEFQLRQRPEVEE
jgi:hypothetical protein